MKTIASIFVALLLVAGTSFGQSKPIPKNIVPFRELLRSEIQKQVKPGATCIQIQKDSENYKNGPATVRAVIDDGTPSNTKMEVCKNYEFYSTTFVNNCGEKSKLMDIKWESKQTNNDSCLSNTFVNNNVIKSQEEAGCCNLFKYLQLDNSTEKNKWLKWARDLAAIEENWNPDVSNPYGN